MKAYFKFKILMLLAVVSTTTYANGYIVRNVVVSNAEEYLNHQWTATSDNVNPNCSNVSIPNYVKIGENTSLPYCWGGWDSVEKFDDIIRKGYTAGDENTSKAGFSGCSAGVDCSGFVANCLGLIDKKYNTNMLGITGSTDISEPVAPTSVKPGDFFNKSTHVRLVTQVNANGTITTIEATAGNIDRVYQTTYKISDLTKYEARKYKYILDDQGFVCKTDCFVDLSPNCSTLSSSFDDNTATFSGLTISKNGEQGAQPYQIAYYLSTVKYVNNGSLLLGTQNMPGLLENSTVTAPPITFSTDGISANNYYVIAVVDYENVNKDPNFEDNDCFTTNTIHIGNNNPVNTCYGDAPCIKENPIDFSCESGCNNDLTLNCGSISAEEKNSTIVISESRITNNGSTTANDILIEFALVGSEGEIPLTAAIPGSDIIEEIAPGVTITGPAPVLAYPNELSGTYQLKVKLKNSSNSCISTEQLNINIEEPLPPETSSGDIDLVFNNCGSITENDNGYSIAYDLQNIGSETITATQLGAYLSSDEIVDQDDVLIKEFPIQSLGQDYSIRFSISFNLNNIVLPQGDAYIILKLDNDNIASETNESNNTCVKKLKGQSCNYTITNNTDCEIDLFWSNHNLSEHFEGTTITPFDTLTTSIEDGFRWTSGKINLLYETAHCASPSYVINASACLSTVCNKEDGYVSHYSLNKNYHAENYIIAPLPGYTNLVKANNNATLKAGEYICLKPGFHARYGSDFLASIEACSNESAPKISSSTEALTLQNFPNPFSGKTTIEFELPNDSKATLFVTDMMGKKVATLLDNEAQAKGYHTVNFDGSNYSPGMYYYTLQAGDYIETQKMILMK